MPKTVTTFFFLMLCTLYTQAQITIGSETFPVIGDALKTEFDNAPNPDLIQITAEGPNQNWDFASLMSPQTTETNILSPSEGTAAAAFPDASYLILTNAGEAYFKKDDNKVELLGFAGPDPLGLGVDVTVVYENPATQRKAPLNYGDSYSDVSKFKISIDADLIPGLDTLGLPVSPDSIRLTLENNVLVEADAWGNLKVPNVNFDVLRLKRTTDTTIKIEGFAFGAWLDITALITGFFDFPTNNTAINYEFVSNESREIVATTSFDNDTVRTVQYIASDYTTNIVNSAKANQRSMTPYPNPAINTVRIDVNGFETDTYTLKIYNIVGEVVHEQQVNIEKGITTLKIDIRKLDTGAFLCSLLDRRKRVLSTSRLVKVGA